MITVNDREEEEQTDMKAILQHLRYLEHVRIVHLQDDKLVYMF